MTQAIGIFGSVIIASIIAFIIDKIAKHDESAKQINMRIEEERLEREQYKKDMDNNG